MRIAIAAETFLPYVTGIAGSVCQIVSHCAVRNHDVMVIAPGPGDVSIEGCDVVRCPSVPAPMYPAFRVGVPAPRSITATLRAFRPDVIHLASPLLLGGIVALAARRSQVPTVAVFQTDYAGFLRQYRLRALERPVWRWLRGVHEQATITLASSRSSLAELAGRGIHPAACWGRGVNTELFCPDKRSEDFRATVSRGRPLVIGYVGRLAREKKLDRLRRIALSRDAQLILVGDGPDRRRLESILPTANFLGLLERERLATAMASLDVFVHAGTNETFCQAIQEAQSCGVAVVAARSAGAVDLIQDDVTGLFFRADDENNLVQVVSLLCRNASLRLRLGRAAHEATRQRTWAVVCDELFHHYETAITTDRTRR
jgi:phosphatidylinositol alpha 1,6-mannosyltransferase